MRLNKLIDVEVGPEKSTYTFPKTAETYNDSVSGPFRQLFSSSGRYILKVDFPADEDYKYSCAIRRAWAKSDKIDNSGDDTVLIKSEEFLVTRELEGTGYRIADRDGNEGIIELENPVFKIIPYIPRNRYFRVIFKVRGKKNKTECPSKKQAFSSWYDAKIASRDGVLRERMKAIYKCKICGQWHLTTKDGGLGTPKKEIYSRSKEKESTRKLLKTI